MGNCERIDNVRPTLWNKKGKVDICNKSMKKSSLIGGNSKNNSDRCARIRKKKREIVANGSCEHCDIHMPG